MENLVLGQCKFFDLDAQDSATPPVSHNATFNVKVADYSKGYVAKQGDARIYFVPKQVGQVDILITGSTPSGVALPAVTITYLTTASGGPAEATHFVVGTQTIAGAGDLITPGDPGVDNVSGSL